MDVEFRVTSTIDDTEPAVLSSGVTVKARESEPLTFEVSHESAWSLRWQAEDPEDPETRTKSDSLPVDGPGTVECPPVPVFDP